LLAGIRSRLTYANVMATIAVFVALGGAAWAVVTAPRNSVLSSSIKNGEVKRKDFGVAPKFTSVPRMPGAVTGCSPGFGDVWGAAATGDTFNGVGYWRDPMGIVHLRGVAVRCNSAGNTVFTLPEGYRPDVLYTLPAIQSTGPGRLEITRTGEVVSQLAQNESVSFQGMSFPCGTPGEGGCP
jgi:hypothetical protein